MSEAPRKSQFLIYQAENGAIAIDVRFEDETVWLTQQLMADLFQTTKQNIGQHLKNIFEEGELAPESVVKNFFTTAVDRKSYSTNYYNLDTIIPVGYRVKSVWHMQPLIAELFQTTVPNISMHLRNIYEEGELAPDATLKQFLTVRQEGARQTEGLPGAIFGKGN